MKSFFIIYRRGGFHQPSPKPGFRRSRIKSKKPGFSQFLGGVTIFSAKTRFLATQFLGGVTILSQKPGFRSRIKSKKPGFSQFLGGVTIFSAKTRFLATPKITETGFFAPYPYQ
ncbi:MAG: hypothetical protein U7126_27885 [Microcoleus sp.]|jgi:hypothetical protein|nr:hypothetical protein [Microcoleaceae cyanobacterium UBA9251]